MTTLQFDPSGRFILVSSGIDGSVYLNPQPALFLPTMASDRGLLADTTVMNAFSAMDDSSSAESADQAKRPLMAADKRRKIRKVTSKKCASSFFLLVVGFRLVTLWQIRGQNSLPSLTRDARQKEAERIRKQKELDEIEIIARGAVELDEIIDISSGDEAAAADARVAAPVAGSAELGPLVCTVESRLCVVNLEVELVSKLKSHQMEGIKFIWGHLSDSEGFGCILADEMGLGKTLTSLVTLHALRLAGVCKHALIVCPSLVISTWSEQTEKWLPKGSGMRRLCVISPEVPHAKRLGKLQSWADQGGLCVIGYEMFRETCSQADSPSAVLLTATPDVVVVDEGKTAATCYGL